MLCLRGIKAVQLYNFLFSAAWSVHYIRMRENHIGVSMPVMWLIRDSVKQEMRATLDGLILCRVVLGTLPITII